MQALRPANFPRRVVYCEWLLQQCCGRPNFLNYTLFTDEAGFTRNAVFNSHNTHIWCYENSHTRQEVRFQRRFSINVWAVIVNQCLVRHYVFSSRLNAAQCLEFFNNVLEKQLDVEMCLRERVRI